MIDDVVDLEEMEALLFQYEPGESNTVKTLSDVAAVLGVQPQTVRAWRMESPPMPGEPGRYNLDEIEAWKNQRASRNETPGMAELNVESQRAELWRRLESVRGKRLKNDEFENSLIPVATLEQDLEILSSIINRKFERFHERCAARVAHITSPELTEGLSQEIQHSVAHALRELRDGTTAMVEKFKKRKPD
jgi:hypothetical protein